MPSLGDVALVGIGGGLGSIARYLVALGCVALLGPSFPFGTLVVNVTGCFVAGVVLGIGDARGLATPARLAILTGFLGGYTTFSAFGVETMRLAEQQGLAHAGINVAANVVVGLVAAAAGFAVGRAC